MTRMKIKTLFSQFDYRESSVRVPKDFFCGLPNQKWFKLTFSDAIFLVLQAKDVYEKINKVMNRRPRFSARMFDLCLHLVSLKIF